MAGRLAGWRIALRLARREALRRRRQTALMLLLVMLPVVAVSAAAVVWRTADVSKAEGIERRMGAAQAIVTPGGADRVAQAFDSQDAVFSDGEPSTASASSTRAAVEKVLGPRPVVPIAKDTIDVEVPGGRAVAGYIETPFGDPLTRGLFRLESGRYPAARGEVLVNPRVLERGEGIGDTLTVVRETPDGERRTELRIVGVAENAATRGGMVLGVVPGALGAPVLLPDGTPLVQQSWLVGGSPVSWDDVLRLNAVGLLADSRAVLADPPPDSALAPEIADTGEPVDEIFVTTLALVVTMVLLEVVLLAGPAFAVRAKAQARTLALVAAVGATPAQARRTVLASGVVVGAVGGAVGIVLGIGLGALALPFAQRTSFAWFGPFDVPWPLLAIVALFGLVAAVAAAVVPAVSASRLDVVAVLGGRRGEGRVSGRSPVIGLVLIGAGVACGVLGSRSGSVSPPLVAASALLSVLGMIGLVGVSVAGLSRAASRLPLSVRFAARDAARHRTRTVPAVAAVAASVAGVVTLGIALSTQDAAQDRDYTAQLPMGWGAVTTGSADVDTVLGAVVRELGPGRATTIAGLASPRDGVEFSDLSVSDGEESLLFGTYSSLGTSWVVDDVVPTFLGVPDGQQRAARAALGRGEVVALVPAGGERSREIPDARLTVDLSAESGDQTQTTLTAPVHVVAIDATYTSASGIVPPSLLPRLKLTSKPAGVVVPPGISAEEQEAVTESVAAIDSGGYFYVERGYQPDDASRIIRWVLVLLGAVLMLGGTLTATFLALSDARPDLATMAAVGARPRTRRRVAASYALVVGGVGAVLGVGVGFVPGLAIGHTIGASEAGDVFAVPWLQVAVVVLGLPLLTAGAVGLAARSRLPLVARID